MIDDQDKSSARPAIILLFVVFLVAGFSVKFGLQTLTWIEGKLWSSDNPWILNVPQPLAAPAAATKSPQVKAYNYEFNSPWPGNPKMAGSMIYTEFRYDSGPVIVFFDPDSQIDTIRALKTSNPIEYQKFAAVFADKPLNSNYDMYQAVYESTPAQQSPVMDAAAAMRINVSLLWKLSFGLDLPCDGQFYSFNWDKLKGFQFGDPEKQRPVAVRAFDDRDHQFRFIFTTAGGTSGKIAQSDINTVLQTFQSVPIIER
jgi:hypothetical protein